LISPDGPEEMTAFYEEAYERDIDDADIADHLADDEHDIRHEIPYSGADQLYSMDVDMDAEVRIVGDPANGAYEWIIVEHGIVTKHSDCGYGMPSIAMRDGLVEFHGLPERKST
jgi:hypothetical protein